MMKRPSETRGRVNFLADVEISTAVHDVRLYMYENAIQETNEKLVCGMSVTNAKAMRKILVRLV